MAVAVVVVVVAMAVVVVVRGGPWNLGKGVRKFEAKSPTPSTIKVKFCK